MLNTANTTLRKASWRHPLKLISTEEYIELLEELAIKLDKEVRNAQE